MNKLSNIDLLTLLMTKGVGSTTVRVLLESHNKPVYSFNEWIEILNSLKLKKSIKLTIPSEADLKEGFNKAKETIAKSEQEGIHIIGYNDSYFPENLRKIPRFPILLNVKGNIKLLSEPQIAIIGTRNPSHSGLKGAAKLAKIFVENNFHITSGLALGCDTAGHEGCLEAGGKTIAILPGGLDKITPKKNQPLADRILREGGTLVSEYFLGTPNLRSNFVERDRLQSGMSQGIVIIETGETGGTWHTIDYARSQQRPIACMMRHKAEKEGTESTKGNKLMIHKGIAFPLDSTDAINTFITSIKSNDFHQIIKPNSQSALNFNKNDYNSRP